MPSNLFRRSRRRVGTSGNVSVETALLLSFLFIPASLGVWDAGVALDAKSRLDQAVRAAIFYVASNPSANATNASGIAAAAAAAYSGTPTVTSAAGGFCVSSGQTGVTETPVSCTGSCPQNAQLATYLGVTVGASVALPLPLPWLRSPISLSAQGRVRTA
jgi:Flp pilus assembly protein TadG